MFTKKSLKWSALTGDMTFTISEKKKSEKEAVHLSLSRKEIQCLLCLPQLALEKLLLVEIVTAI